MNSRERVIKTLQHQEPDFVPLTDHIYMKESLEKILGELGVSTQTPAKYVKVHRLLGLDVICGFSSDAFHPPPEYVDGQVYVDDWNVKWKVKDRMNWHLEGQLKDYKDIEEFKAPSPENPQLYQTVREIIKLVGNDLAIAGFVDGPFTKTWLSTGFENWVKMSYLKKNVLSILLDEITKYSTEVGKRLIEEGVDIIWIPDDYGDVKGPMLNPKIYRSLIFPRVKRMIEVFKKRGAYVFLHSDGNLMPIFDDLVTIGFDAIHPIERKSGMRIENIKENYGSKITLIGNVDSMLLQTGPHERIEEQVLECLEKAAYGGGYILASDHSIHQGVPAKNVKFMFKTARRYGRYPIKL